MRGRDPHAEHGSYALVLALVQCECQPRDGYGEAVERAELDLLLTRRSLAALDAETALEGPVDPFARSAALRAAGFGPAETAALLTQADLRRRAVKKFGPFAAGMLFTRAGLEQATRLEIAAQHAGRVRAAGFTAVADLGCGIGGDAMAFAGLDLDVLAVERDEVVAAVAGFNLASLPSATVQVGDAEAVAAPGGSAVWLDPARRTAGHSGTRRVGAHAWSPSLDFALATAASRSTGVKLSPALDQEAIPDDVEAQWVSSRGETAELVLWSGGLARTGVRRSALVVGPDGAAELTAAAPAGDEPPGPLGSHLHEPDGAVIRARLLGDLARATGTRPVGPGIAYLTGDGAVESPFLTSFRIDEVLPLDRQRVAKALRARGVGRLEVKKRGVDLDPAAFRKSLALRGDGEAVLVATRGADRRIALICSREG